MPRRDDRAVLADILEGGNDIAVFFDGLDVQQFLCDKKTQAAVLHRIMVIGEAAKLLSPAFREVHGQIPWQRIARMRDRLIHGYTAVDLTVVWDTASDSIPKLVLAIEPRVNR